MAYNITALTTRIRETEEWLQREFNSIRTGRATPALLDIVQVEAYNTRVPLQQVGSVGVEDARTLRVTCWDTGQIKNVEKAIQDADLGVSLATDEQGLRVIFPELTADRRAQLLKLAKHKYEEARVSLRGARDEILKAVDTACKHGELSEDERFSTKERVQKEIDAGNKKLDELLALKEKEITE